MTNRMYKYSLTFGTSIMLFKVWGGGTTYLSDIYIKQGNLSGVKACGCYIITVWHCCWGKGFLLYSCAHFCWHDFCPHNFFCIKTYNRSPLAIMVFLRADMRVNCDVCCVFFIIVLSPSTLWMVALRLWKAVGSEDATVLVFIFAYVLLHFKLLLFLTGESHCLLPQLNLLVPCMFCNKTIIIIKTRHELLYFQSLFFYNI